MRGYAILVGISDYLDPQIKSLSHTNNAIKSLLNALMYADVFEPTNMKVFIKEDETKILDLPMKYSLISFLNYHQRWRIQREDLFLFYFIGHGYGSTHGDQILTMDTCFEYLEETALSVATLTRLIRRIPARHKLLVFDCCRNEVEGMLGDQEGLGKRKIREEEFITLYACQPRERAYIPLQGKLPLLTEAFIRAVENANCLSIRDMENLVIDHVTETSYSIGARQTPEIIAIGQDLGDIGFLARTPHPKAVLPSQDFIETMKQTKKELHDLYEKIYPHHAPSWKPFMDAASKLTSWETMIDHRSFRRYAFELLESGENADLYMVSYMLSRGPDLVLFEPLIESLASRKYRGTVAWQVLSALETMLRQESMTSRLAADTKLRVAMISVMQKLAKEHPTREDYRSPFESTVVWGKILQICQRLQIPEREIFPEDALQRLEAGAS